MVLLGAAVVAVLAGRSALVRGGIPVAAAAVVVVAGGLELDEAGEVLAHLVEPLVFVAVAVVLAEGLAAAGVFRAFAAAAPRGRRDAVLWVLAAVTVVVLNLDAAVVLLTPLYVSIARESGEDPLALAAQPALVACLASSVLPVSNLTNLIAVHADRADLGLFLGSLAGPTVVAVAVGYVGWRWRFGRGRAAAHPPAPLPLVIARASEDDAGRRRDRSARRLGVVVTVALVVGFVPLAAVGVPQWLTALVVLAGVSVRRRQVPEWRHLPVALAGAACGLAVLATALTTHLDLAAVLGDGRGALGELRVVAVAAVGANLVDNLPAFLAALPVVEGDGAVAALLLGVNAGPVLLVTGSLSGLLWLDVARRSGLAVSARTYLWIGVSALPAVLAAALVLVAT